MNTRELFVAEFGENEALVVEEAAHQHRTSEGGNLFAGLCEAFAGRQEESAPDRFLLDLSWCISWECISRDSFRAYHGFKADKEKVRQWVIANAWPPRELRDPAAGDKYAAYLGESS